MCNCITPKCSQAPEKARRFLCIRTSLIPARESQLDRRHFAFDDAPVKRLRACGAAVTNWGLCSMKAKGGWHLRSTVSARIEYLPVRPKRRALFFLVSHSTRLGVNTSDEARTTLLIQMRDPSDIPALERTNRAAKA
jgi:hypothetical protein